MDLLAILTTILFVYSVFLPETTVADDVTALLSFKQSSVTADPNNNLQNWTAVSGNNRNPCSWAGVRCSTTSGRVTGIDLSNFGLVGRLKIDDLMVLSDLQFVDLQGNSFSGNLTYSAEVSSCSFVSVDLSGNNFSGTLGGNFLSKCPGLVELNLSGNAIVGGVYPFGSSLKTLDLSRNKISDYELYRYTTSDCRSLSYLNLSDNAIDGELLSMSRCGNLTSVDLSYNFFTGNFPVGFFSGLPSSMSQLFIKKNNFTGEFSAVDFGACINLTVLDLSENKLIGVGLPETLANCKEMQWLDLSGNNFSGAIPPSIAKLGNLTYLSLANNKYSGIIPPELSALCGSLEDLDFSGNSLTEGLPSTFVGCSSIQRLNLGDNQISDDFINTVVGTMSSLRHLLVSFNYIAGDVPLLSLKNLTLLEEIDLSSNNFTGEIPEDLCYSFPSLQKIQLQGNYITGPLPKSMADCTHLSWINLSLNYLSGPIPPEIFLLPNITNLMMWGNSLTGEIPDHLCTPNPSLRYLILNHNKISGTIPSSITRCENMDWLFLSSNLLTGKIPDSIGNLKKFTTLQLSNNSITGEIPHGIGDCESLMWVDLCSNKLSGPIPDSFAKSVNLIKRHKLLFTSAFLRNEGGPSCPITGILFEFSGIRMERFMEFPIVNVCPSMRVYITRASEGHQTKTTFEYVDLSYNLLSGPIPENVGNFSDAYIINLGHNQLTGPIPRSFRGLTQVAVLDLSHNNLTGSVPGELGMLSFLHDLYLSYNNLSGPITATGQLITLPTSTFEGNPGLCGLPLPPCQQTQGGGNQNSESKKKQRKKSVMISVMIGISVSAFVVIAAVTVLFKVKRRNPNDEKTNDGVEFDGIPGIGAHSNWKLNGVVEPSTIAVATFEKPLKQLTFADLLESTNGFSPETLIGSGGFGEVYRARLKDGNVVAIKKLVHATRQGDRELTAEMETIGKIKHRNLVPLLGYCKVGDERLLVYEYMKHGSLESVLQNRKQEGIPDLTWSVRKKIAIGSARGLAFLHHSCIPHIIHRDMKSSNVLVDENLDARVSDFGMARLMNAVDTHLSVSSLAGTPGYVPPEYYQSFRCTTKGDVYSYGVVLMELLSGKMVIDTSSFGDDNLVGWAKKLVKENRLDEIIDSDLKVEGSDDAEMFKFLKIACDCMEDRPARRPNMIQVLIVFKEIVGDSVDFDVLEGLSLKEVQLSTRLVGYESQSSKIEVFK